MWAGSRRCWIEAAATLGLLAAAPGSWACSPRITAPPPETRIPYDPFVSTRVPATIGFTVANTAEQACAVDVAVLDENRQTLATVPLSDAPVIVELRPGQGTALVATATPGVWTVTLPAKGELPLQLSAAIVGDGVPPAGRHQRSLNLELREAGAAVPIGSAVPLVLALDTPPRSQMNIAGAAGAFGEGLTISSVDLGVLNEGLARRVFLQVRSNVAFSRLTVESEHRGLLMPKVDEPVPDAPGIPYTIAIADLPVDLSERSERRIEAPHSLAGASLPLDIIVGDVSGRMGGSYQDVLTFELSPL